MFDTNRWRGAAAFCRPLDRGPRSWTVTCHLEWSLICLHSFWKFALYLRNMLSRVLSPAVPPAAPTSFDQFNFSFFPGLPGRPFIFWFVFWLLCWASRLPPPRPTAPPLLFAKCLQMICCLACYTFCHGFQVQVQVKVFLFHFSTQLFLLFGFLCFGFGWGSPKMTRVSCASGRFAACWLRNVSIELTDWKVRRRPMPAGKSPETDSPRAPNSFAFAIKIENRCRAPLFKVFKDI